MSVRYESRDRIGYITLDRPQALNGIDESMLAGLDDVFGRAAQDESVKAVVIAGAGDVFCVGLDIKLLSRAFEDDAYFKDVLERFKTLLLKLEALPVPVLAAVNGLTRAG